LESSTAKTNKPLVPSQLRVRPILAGALLFALAGAALPPVSMEEERAALAKAKAQSLIAEQRAAMLDARAGVAEEAADVARARAAAVALRIQAAESDLSAAETRISLIERMRAEQSARLASAQAPAMRLLAALQMLSRRPPALALIQPGSTDDLVHTRAILSALIPRIRRQTAGLRAEIERSRALRADADRARSALALSRTRLDEQRAEFLQLSAAKRADFDQLRGAALAEEDRAIGLSEQANDIGDLMQSMSADGVVRDRLAALSGPVLRPLDGRSAPLEAAAAAVADRTNIPYRLPVAGTVVAGLGDVSEAGVRARGLTLAVRPTAQLVAPSSGRIAFAGPFRGYGQIVIIDHGGGWTSLITSLSALDVVIGENVVQGSPIGRAGTDRPTVSVELRQKGQPVDISRLVS
jgi:murein hydrolase activator